MQTAALTINLDGKELTPQETIGINSPPATETVSKRKPDDPIYVKLSAPVLDKKVRQAEMPKGAIGLHIRHEFASDSIIQLLPEPKSKVGHKTSQPISSSVDVEVASRVSLKEVMRLNGTVGKPSKTINIVFEGTVTSQAPPFSTVVIESGPVLQHMAISKRFASHIRTIIVEQIGPDIPAR